MAEGISARIAAIKENIQDWSNSEAVKADTHAPFLHKFIASIKIGLAGVQMKWDLSRLKAAKIDLSQLQEDTAFQLGQSLRPPQDLQELLGKIGDSGGNRLKEKFAEFKSTLQSLGQTPVDASSVASKAFVAGVKGEEAPRAVREAKERKALQEGVPLRGIAQRVEVAAREGEQELSRVLNALSQTLTPGPAREKRSEGVDMYVVLGELRQTLAPMDVSNEIKVQVDDVWKPEARAKADQLMEGLNREEILQAPQEQFEAKVQELKNLSAAFDGPQFTAKKKEIDTLVAGLQADRAAVQTQLKDSLAVCKVLADSLGIKPPAIKESLADQRAIVDKWVEDNRDSLKGIAKLDLSDNRLTSLPPEIGELTGLRELNLSGNRLKTLPPEIGKLQDLEKLGLANNPLESYPEEIYNMPKLGRIPVPGRKK